MRANKDEGKPEPHTLAKFANPYFKDASSMVSYPFLYMLLIKGACFLLAVNLIDKTLGFFLASPWDPISLKWYYDQKIILFFFGFQNYVN